MFDLKLDEIELNYSDTIEDKKFEFKVNGTEIKAVKDLNIDFKAQEIGVVKLEFYIEGAKINEKKEGKQYG